MNDQVDLRLSPQLGHDPEFDAELELTLEPEPLTRTHPLLRWPEGAEAIRIARRPLFTPRLAPERQYIPPMPPPGMAGALSSSFFSTTTHSVVMSSEAIDAAF